MQFSKKVSGLARTYNIDHKDVLLAFLISSGASIAESYAVIYRPAATTNNALQSRASNHLTQRPALQRLIADLDKENNPDADEPKKRAGRPRTKAGEDVPELDYTDKDAVLKELARIAGRCEKESDRLAAIREISSLQRMKAEAAVDDEKRVVFYIPLSYKYCEDLRLLLSQKSENQGK